MRVTGIRILSGLLLAGAGLAALPASAQKIEPAPIANASPEPDSASIAAGLLVTTPPRPARCGTTGPRGEIVVCGADHGEDVRVPSTTDSDPDSKEAQDTGIPQAPSVSGLFDCKKSKCHGIGGAPPPVYIVDMKSIKEAPKGSDADKVANGEMSDR